MAIEFLTAEMRHNLQGTCLFYPCPRPRLRRTSAPSQRYDYTSSTRPACRAVYTRTALPLCLSSTGRHR